MSPRCSDTRRGHVPVSKTYDRSDKRLPEGPGCGSQFPYSLRASGGPIGSGGREPVSGVVGPECARGWRLSIGESRSSSLLGAEAVSVVT